MLFLQEEQVGDFYFEIFDVVRGDTEESWSYYCWFCSDKGACAQCAVGKCVVAYHALCALRNGIKLRFMEDQVTLDLDLVDRGK